MWVGGEAVCNLGSCQENYIPAVKLKYRFDWSVRPGTRADVEWIAGVLDRGSNCGEADQQR